MPIKAYNVSRQRSGRHTITINGPLTGRARRLRNLRLKEDNEARTLADFAAIDRVLVNVIGYTSDIEAESRDFRREALFDRNGLHRAILVVLRQANDPLTMRQSTPGLEPSSVDGLQAWRRAAHP